MDGITRGIIEKRLRMLERGEYFSKKAKYILYQQMSFYVELNEKYQHLFENCDINIPRHPKNNHKGFRCRLSKHLHYKKSIGDNYDRESNNKSSFSGRSFGKGRLGVPHIQ